MVQDGILITPDNILLRGEENYNNTIRTMLRKHQPIRSGNLLEKPQFGASYLLGTRRETVQVTTVSCQSQN